MASKKTATNELIIKERSTPANETDWGKVYPKTDKKLYYMDSDGNEVDISTPGEHTNGYDLQVEASLPDLSFVDGTRTFSAAVKGTSSNFYFWAKGLKITKTTTQSVVIPNVTGTYYIVFDNTGTLVAVEQSIVTLTAFYENAITGLVYWNATAGTSIVGNEKHGIRMSASTHHYNHNTYGARYESGLAIEGLSDGGDTYTQTTSGKFWDEDIQHSIAALSTAPFIYRLGADGEWTGVTADANISHNAGGTYDVWNENTGSTWQLTEGGTLTDYFITFFIATPDLSGNAIKKIISQSAYSSRLNARNAIETEKQKLILDGLPSPEFIFIGAIIVKRDGILVTLSDDSLYLDLRETKGAGAGSGSGTTSYAADIPTDTTNFDSLLSSADTNVQLALDTLDDGAADLGNNLYLSRSFYFGTFKEAISATVSSDGTTITMSLQSEDAGDLSMQFSDAITILDCTPAQTIALTAGTQQSPQENYIYIPQSTKVLTKSTSQWPSAVEHIRVGFFYAQTAALTQAAGGTLVNQNWNDALSGIDDRGHITHIGAWIRAQGANWFSGVDGNGTDGYLTPYAGGATFQVSSGIIMKLHQHAFPAVDTSGTDTVYCTNYPGAFFKAINDVNDMLIDSESVSLTGRYYNIILFGAANKGGTYSPVGVQLPSGSYNSSSNAIDDPDNYDDYSVHRAFTKDSSVGFLIARITIRNQSDTTFTVIQTQDLRGERVPTSKSTVSATALTEFADNQFKIYNNTDSTKIAIVDCSAVTTGNTRTITMKDENVDLKNVLHNNYTATAAPGASDDSGDDYAVGSMWIDVTADIAYICVDSTASSAVWKQISN